MSLRTGVRFPASSFRVNAVRFLAPWLPDIVFHQYVRVLSSYSLRKYDIGGGGGERSRRKEEREVGGRMREEKGRKGRRKQQRKGKQHE